MSKAITQSEFERRIKVRFPDENFTIIKYESLGKPAEIQCNQCKKIISISKASNFVVPTKAHGCVNCHGLWREREKRLEAIKEKYDILDTFVKDTHTHYHVKCKQCGHERTTTLKNLYKHLECGCITNVYRGRTSEEFLKEVNRNTKDKSEFELVSEYVDQTTKVLLRHKPCNFIWSVRPGDVIHGRSFCPKCGRTQSMGERIISQLLNKYEIPFDSEYQLNNSKQRFDFYIELGETKIAIEYNGKQHYEEVEFFGSSLAQYQERDNRKQKYCIDNGIELVIIPYTDSLEVIENKIQTIANRLNDQLI